MTAQKPSSSSPGKPPVSPVESTTSSHRRLPHPPTTSSHPSPPSGSHRASPKPHGPRSPENSKRDNPGSARTKYRTMPLSPAEAHGEVGVPAAPAALSSASSMQLDGPVEDKPPVVPPPASQPEPAEDVTQHETPHQPYRPPEPVIEPLSDSPPGYTPGIVAEHPESDDEMVGARGSASRPFTIRSVSSQSTLSDKKVEQVGASVDQWQANLKEYNMMEVDDPTLGVGSLFEEPPVERPQIGPGVLPRRWLAAVHEHELVQPYLEELPQPAAKRGPGAAPGPGASPTRPKSVAGGASSPSAPLASPAPAEAQSHLATLEDVWNALPGDGRNPREWFFCTTCWAWMRIRGGRGDPPWIPNMEEWEGIVTTRKVYTSTAQLKLAKATRQEDWDRYVRLQISRGLAPQVHHHLHEFGHLVESHKEERIERVEVDPEMNVFPHFTFPVDTEERWTSFSVPSNGARLFLSCASDLWIMVDEGMTPGQLPVGLVKEFTMEKMSNPGVGFSGAQSVSEAWTLLITLLINPLFKGQRGWVRLNNPTYQRKIGAGIISSHLLYQIGFACQQDEDGLRVGPFKIGEDASAEDKEKLEQMDRYMLRAWVELTLYVMAFQKRNNLNAINPPWMDAVPLTRVLGPFLDLAQYPTTSVPIPDAYKDACTALGMAKSDASTTIELAYDLQIACDWLYAHKYLSALIRLSEGPLQGKANLQMKAAMEQSMGKLLQHEVDNAYNLIGFTAEYADLVCITAEEAPASQILKMHKEAIDKASSASERSALSKALVVIGKQRRDQEMIKMGETETAMMSVKEAYEALSAPMDAVDEGVLMQYEMAVNEYPGKADHYRKCLATIADAPGQERPGLQSFLRTGTRQPDAPARKDVPVGLQNIGYLNSILQYLYSIKPLRDAVLSFEQDGESQTVQSKNDVERAKRFVRQLRLLFLQLYKSEQTAVRPDEVLAYLAITRPDADDPVPDPAPATVTAPAPPTSRATSPLPPFSSIPDMVPPSPTEIATPEGSPPHQAMDISAAASPETETEGRRSRAASSTSVLGKRGNGDRDDKSQSPTEDRVRHKSESSNIAVSPMEVDEDEVLGKENPVEEPVAGAPAEEGGKVVNEGATSELVESPSMETTMEMGHLDLSSIPPDAEPVPSDAAPGETKYDAPTVPPPPPPPLPPRPQADRKATLDSGLRVGLQQDSAEVLINVLSQLELALDRPSEDGTQTSNLIKSLYSCKFRQQIVYEAAPTVDSDGKQKTNFEAQKPVESVFTHPIIGVEEEGKDLYDCLGELYLKGADIEYEGRKGYIMELMDEFPPMLYIQMRRSQYDWATGRESKTNTHIPFQQTLSMGRFLCSADPKKREQAIDITREITRIRTRLHHLTKANPISIPGKFAHVASALRELSRTDIELPELNGVVTSEFCEALDGQSQATAAEITSLQEALPRFMTQMDELWKSGDKEGDSDVGEWDYELVSVFMHRGKTSGSGHYWTYQAHLPGHSDEFYSYNDETVTVVPASEVLQDRTGDDANPALLCYARKGRGLIDVLHREVLEREAADDADKKDVDDELEVLL
ncbi:hypothetical protein IAT38_004555 [Cryptococcus sp. DSM 104549]